MALTNLEDDVLHRLLRTPPIWLAHLAARLPCTGHAILGYGQLHRFWSNMIVCSALHSRHTTSRKSKPRPGSLERSGLALLSPTSSNSTELDANIKESLLQPGKLCGRCDVL